MNATPLKPNGLPYNVFSVTINDGYTERTYKMELGDSNSIASLRSMFEAAPELLEALEEQDSVDEWIESANVSDPFFEETLRQKLNYARDLRQSALAKAKEETP